MAPITRAIRRRAPISFFVPGSLRMLDLADSTQLLRLLAEPTRLRLLLLLIDQPMTVAELTNVTQLTQSRVSSHLARLREAELVQDRAVANARFYSVDVKRWHHDMRPLWGALLDTLDDAIVHRDRRVMRVTKGSRIT